MRKFVASFIFIISFMGMATSQSFLKNELLIQVQPNASVRVLGEKLISLAGSQIEFMTSISEPMRIYHVKFKNNVNLDEIIKQSSEISEIAIIQKNHRIEDRVTVPDDTYFSSQWHLSNTGQTGGNPDADIDAPEAWDITTGGNTSHGDTIVVCVIESQGVDINHIDLAGNIWKNHQEIPGNGIDDDNNGYIDDYDGWNVGNNSGIITGGSHGTRVAGMIGAIGNNGTLVSGVNHTVKMMIIQGQAANNEATVIQAYTYPLMMRKKYNASNGTDGAFVVATNASWGIENGNPANSPLWCNFYDSLGVHGILNIGATTNSGSKNVDIFGDLPTTCPSEYLVGVTSTNQSDFRSGGYGPIHVDLGAPGANVTLPVPGDTINSSSGTSFATPCVAGAVALFYSAPCTDFISYAKTYPDSAALQMRALILDNVDNISALSGDVSSGGRLNINNSLQALVNSCDTSSCLTPYAVTIDSITDTQFQLNWQNNSNSGYLIDYKIIGSSNSSQIAINSGTDASYVITGLIPCTNYEVTITGICGADTSATSTIFTVRTDGCCENPQVNVVAISETAVSLNWLPVLYSTEYIIRYQLVGSNNWLYDTITTTNTNISSLDTCSDYDIQIKTVCGDSSHVYSPSYQIRTKGCGICFEGDYCEINPSAVSTLEEWIESFTINGITSTTGNNEGYFNGGIFGNGLAPGNGYEISFTPGYAGSNYTEYYKVWIDMDQNGEFESTDELISNISGQNTQFGMLFIPQTTVYGITKMRIGMTGQTAPTLCADQGGFIYGEYEDYCIFISNTASVDGYSNAVINLYPNPTTDLVTIGTDENIDLITVYDMSGKTVLTIQNPSTNQISMLDFESGMYTVSVMINGALTQQKLIKQ